jgi:hypothetical protein
MQDDALYAKLPAVANKTLREGISGGDASKIVKALKALGFPVDTTFPTVAELSEAHRAAATILAAHEVPDISFKEKGHLRRFALPSSAAGRRRWLGLDPAGPLDAVVAADGGGAPLWRVLQARAKDAQWRDEPAEPIRALPAPDRFAVVVDLFDSPYELEQLIRDASNFCLDSEDLDSIDAPFAATLADRVLLLRSKATPGPAPRAGLISREEQWRLLRWTAFLPLVAAKVAVEPRWDGLLPVFSNWAWTPGTVPTLRDELVSRCLGAIPEDRRAGALLAALRQDSQSLFEVLRLCVTQAPAPEVIDALLERTKPPLADSWVTRIVDALATLVPKHPEVRERIDRTLARWQSDKSFEPGKLAAGKRSAPSTADALSVTDGQQVKSAGKLWDGLALEAAARLAPGDEASGSLAGMLEHVEVTSNGKAAYDAWLIADGGTVFESGTTSVVATIAQNQVESSKPKLAKALQGILWKRGR